MKFSTKLKLGVSSFVASILADITTYNYGIHQPLPKFIVAILIFGIGFLIYKGGRLFLPRLKAWVSKPKFI